MNEGWRSEELIIYYGKIVRFTVGIINKSMGVLHIILKEGHPKIISTQISEQKILMWFLSHNIPKRNKLAEQITTGPYIYKTPTN
jgi:hypothetical protein